MRFQNGEVDVSNLELLARDRNATQRGKHKSAQRINLTIGGQVDPDVLIVDEALAVGDALFQKRCFQRLAELRENRLSDVTSAVDTYRQVLELQPDSTAATGALIAQVGGDYTNGIEWVVLTDPEGNELCLGGRPS